MATLTGLQGANFADAAYDLRDKLEGYTLIDFVRNPFINFDTGIFTGFQVALYKNSQGQYVIGFAGTDSILDSITDVSMGIHTLIAGVTSQFIQGGSVLSKWINDYSLSTSNTTIVGHSLGGSLAQYFGATTGFETLTYNAYGIGNETSGGSNITNYITMHDPVSILPGSKMIGTTYMLQDESLYDQLGHGISNFTSESSWVRGYSRVNSPHDIDVIDGIGNSAYELALMAIEGRKFATINGSLNDVIFGGEINNLLIGGGGKDTLYGMGGSDYLKGGKDFDTYISGDSDQIMDSDGKGRVYFEGKLLTGGEARAGQEYYIKPDGSRDYVGNGGVYTLSADGTLTFKKETGEILVIEEFTNDDLGIHLEGETPPEHNCPEVINPSFDLHFTLPSPMTVPISNSGGEGSTYYGGGGGSSSNNSSSPSTPHYTPIPPIPEVQCVNDPQHNSTGTGGGGGGSSPIVLDLNRNGITSIALAASTTLFDYDGDGIKENTAWIESGDALLVNDVNHDGIINNASELFGNYTRNSDGSVAKSGYQALSYYDSNSDGVIDATDTRYNELSVWIDANGDGVTDAGELKTLTEMGITSLKLGDPATPYIPTTENTNTIIQETTFTDVNGEGVMRDILFRYENTSTNKDGVYFDMDGNGIKEKMLTWTDPNQWMVVKDLNGDGLITSGREVIGNQMILKNGTKPADTIQALKTFDINHDGMIDAADNSGLAFWTDRNHNGLTDIGELEALGAAGAIQTIMLNPYQTLLSGYDNNKDGVINSSDALSNYLYIQTNSDDSVTLYLPDNADARTMISGYTGGENIQTTQGEKIIKTIQFYSGYEMALNDTLDGTENSETLEGSSRGETIRGFGGRDIIDAGAGNDTLEGGTGSDKLMGGSGDDTYVFNRGDGKDLVIDTSGNDTIRFANGITRDDLIIKSNGIDISIYLKDGTKPISELSDHIIIKDWYTTGAVENIAFSDGSTMSATSLFESSNSEDKTSITLNGATDALIISNPQDCNVNAGLTLTSTFSYNGMGTGYQSTAYGMIVTKAYTNYESSYLMAIDSTGKLFFQVVEANNTSHRIYSNTILHTGELYDVAATYDKASGMSKIYINGALDTEVTVGSFNIMQSSQRVVIGAYWAGGGSLRSFLNGTVSDVQIYDRSLSESEVNAISNGGIASSSLLTHYDFEDTNPFENKAGGGFIATSVGNPIISGIIETANFSDSFENITTDSTLKINTIESMVDSDISSLTLQSRYTGSGLDGASAQTVFEGVGYTGTLSNVWLKSDTLDTQYTYNGTISDDIKELPNIAGQGNVIGLQEVMNEKSDLAQGVTIFQTLSETGNLADFEANIDSIIEEWALYDLNGESANSTPPIVLDLDGDGVTSTSLASSSAYFDYDGDGRREHTAWADAGDAILAIDLNGDGVITHGAELFGNYTLKSDGSYATDGYDAMAQYDTNSDNVLDASDEQFSKLRLWKDVNQNGKNEPGELSTLAENGISSINLSRTNGTTFTQITEAGNIITQETNYVSSNGDGTVRDVWFSYDGTDTIAYSNLSDSDEKKIAIVENFYGRRLNSEERNSVEVIAEVLNQYNALRYDTIAKIITDKLYGEGFPNCQFLHDALNNTLGRVVGGAASTTETLLAVNLLAALLKREHVGVLSDIYPEYFSNPTIAGLLAQSNIAIGFEEGALIGHIGNRYFGTSAAESFDFSSLDGVRAYMSGGDDTILGSHGIDELVGGEGNDTLNGNGGNDVLDGGQGDDTLIGSATQNVYRYAWGDGNDTIIDAGSEEGAPDTLRLSDLDISRVSVERVGDDMIIHVRDEDGALLNPFDEPFGTITIKDGYANGKIEHFYFRDTRYTFDEVLAYVPADTDYYFVQGDAHVTIDEKGGNDTLHFGDGITKENIIARIVGNDLVIGLAQEGKTFDTLRDKLTILNYASAIEQFAFQDGTTMNLDTMIELAMAHLMINGNDASETLYGGAEGEIFNAMAGDDTIYGEAGDDTYKFGLGDGYDTIIDTAGKDTILLKEGVLASDATLTLDGEDLIVTLKDGSSVRVVSWITTEGRIEQIKDTQGNSVDFSSILKPVVENTTVAGEEDTLLEGSLSVTDISGTPLTYAITTNSQYGVVELNDTTGEWTYVPNANFNGDDSVVVSVTNGYGVTSTSIITLNVSSVNDAPNIEGEDISVTLHNVLTTEGQINAQDIDGDPLSYVVKTQTSHGNLSVDENGKWTYTTTDAYDGEDSAVISVSDGNGGSIDKTLNFTIIDNTAPEAPSEVSCTLQDIRSFSSSVGATDADGNILTYTVSTAASHGTLNIDENGIWNYSAANGFMGTDTAIITINDGNGGVITQTLNFDVKVSIPILSDFTSNLLEDTSTNGIFNVINPIGEALTYEILNTSSKGVFSVNEAGEWSYNPSSNLNGDDSVTVKVTNSYGLSTTATLNLAIEAVNDAPIANGIVTFNAVSEDSGTITITAQQLLSNANDVDGDNLSIKNLTASNGALVDNHNGTWILTPDANFNGTITLNYSVTDGQIDTDAHTIQYVTPVNDAPTVVTNNEHYLLDNIRTVTGTIAASDIDGDLLSYAVSSQAAHGELRVDTHGNWSYKANGSYNGDDYAVITIDDGHGGTVTSVLNFTVKGYIYEGKDLTIDDNGTDTLVMKTINKEDLAFRRKNDDLLISVKNESTITLKNYFLNIQAGIKSITTVQGDISLSRDVINDSQYGGYSASDAKNHLISGDDNSNWLIGNNGNDIIVAGKGYDYINGGDGNDLLIGGADADNLFGGNGNDSIYADDGNDSVYAGTGNDEIFGGKGDDTLFADDGNDTINGGEGNDTIYAGTGNDTIKGGAGNDFINGTTGSDTYLFNLGDGSDTIIDTSAYGSSDIDTLVFGTGITKENLQIIRDNYDLLLQVNDNDSIRVKYWFGSDQRNTLESIVFADQTTLTTDQINNLAIVKGSVGNDWISGIDYMNDHMYGFAGNDGLYGYGGNDTLDGGDDNDILNGGAGNDTLIGGTGSDNLNGGAGSDTYVFTAGDGNDTITDWSQYGSNDADTISFGAGITKNDVRFIIKNGSLLIGYAQNDTINVQYAQNTQAQIEKFTLTDGNYLTSNDINVIIQSMNAYATDHGMSITSLDTVKNNQALMNIVAAGWHQ